MRERGGRLFFPGVGGGAGHASHALNDFRRIAGIESCAPTDNVSVLTAPDQRRGWDSSYAPWLRGSHLSARRGVCLLRRRGNGTNLVASPELAREVGASVFGLVARDGGCTAKLADACVIVPTISAETVTPHTEEFQAVIWHLLVSHPRLRRHAMKWESTQ